MRVVLCGPSGARCGVCVTTTLWALGFQELGVDLRWITNLPLVDTSPRFAPIDAAVTGVKRFEAYRRPDADYCTVEQEQNLSTLWVEACDKAFACCNAGDVFFLEQSGSVIPYGRAADLLVTAKYYGMRTVVRLHSQLLQGLDTRNVDAFVAPFPKEEADALPDSEVRDIPSSKWHVVPHPCGPRVVEPDVAYLHVIGYGQAHRMEHRYMRRAIEEAGYVYMTFGTGEEWHDVGTLLRGIAEARAIVLFYSPLRGVGRSSALNLVLGAQRPVFCSDSIWLKDAEQWGGICDDDEMIVRGLHHWSEPSDLQRAYWNRWHPKAAAARVLENIG